MSCPADALEAVRHPAPYPFYGRLAATCPFSFDERLGCWVASSADTAMAVLESGLCQVRPVDSPVPPAILDSPAADIFRRLVRMTDDGRHGPMKAAIAGALGSVSPEQADATSGACAAALAQAIRGPDDVSAFAFALPLRVMASLLGFPESDLPRIVGLTAAFVKGLSPLATAEQAHACGQAARPLLDMMRSRLEEIAADSPRDLLGALAEAAHRLGCGDPDAVAANAVGLMMQSQEATAGWIGTTLAALSSRWPSIPRETISAALLHGLRTDPPIQNTRRYVARDSVIAGKAVKRGDMILVVLAAGSDGAGRRREAEDPGLAFGHGRHRCPGPQLAATIAKAGIEALATRRVPLPASVLSRAYRPSPNARIPL